MTPEEMDQVLDAHFQAELTQDLDGVLATLTADAEHDAVGYPVPVLHGRDEIRPRYRELFDDFTDGKVEPVRRYHGTDFAVDECVYSATASGTPFGIPGENRPVSFRLLHVCEFRDGLMSRENVWLDVAAILAQLDAIPAAP